MVKVSPAAAAAVGERDEVARSPRSTGAPARSPAPSPAAVLALQRTIGNARVARVLQGRSGVRRLQRTYEGGVRALLNTPLFSLDPGSAAALQALHPPGGAARSFTRHDTARWVEGTPTLEEWEDPAVLELRGLAERDPLKLRGFKDVGNRDALREMKALAAQLLIDLDALVAASPAAGAAWSAKFTALRVRLAGMKATIDAKHYDASLAAVRAPQQDAFRTAFADAAETKLAELRSIGLQIRTGGRLKFSQKRANARFSSAATVNNAATSALVAGRLVSDVAAELTARTIQPDQIPVQVFFRNGEAIAINNRGLAALSLAKMRPTNIIFVPAPAQDFLNRLGESDTFRGAGTITSPAFRMALTATDADTDRTAVGVPETV